MAYHTADTRTMSLSYLSGYFKVFQLVIIIGNIALNSYPYLKISPNPYLLRRYLESSSSFYQRLFQN